MTDDVVGFLDFLLAEATLMSTDTVFLSRSAVDRARDEIVALRGYRAECERQFQAKVAEIGGLLDRAHQARADALEEAARVCEGGYTTGSTASTLTAIAKEIRALKDRA